ncbi:hypothetical protein GH733_010892 [Mirounga leonina]|nr:hypothetical protein GH733_010892 [Mirounga leonina]
MYPYSLVKQPAPVHISEGVGSIDIVNRRWYPKNSAVISLFTPDMFFEGFVTTRKYPVCWAHEGQICTVVFMLNPTQAFLVLLSPVTTDASALEVYTPKEIFVANGTQGKLTCKFKSTNTTGTLTSVSWSFQPEGTDTTVSFFHYSQGQAYPGNYPPFKDRISWAGDLDKKDASINIENMQFIHNGTYICDVKNPPDIVAQPGHIRLYVVEKEILPVFPVWVVVGIVTAVVLGLTLVISMILAVLYRRRNSKPDYTGCSTSESVSPVKQAPRKSPSDTEGLVKSLPSGSHQVMADCSSAHCSVLRSLVLCHFPDAGNNTEP